MVMSCAWFFFANYFCRAPAVAAVILTFMTSLSPIYFQNLSKAQSVPYSISYVYDIHYIIVLGINQSFSRADGKITTYTSLQKVFLQI